RMPVTIRAIEPASADYDSLLAVAEQLGQARYIAATEPYADESVLLGAFAEAGCVGFLRFLIMAIGSEHGRTPICGADGTPLREGYVEAFGVLPEWRRQHIGQALQEHVIDYCRAQGCYQIRSRSPVSSAENYALKLKMGYAIHPSSANDSYYFIKTLEPNA
ncbi:hypothetical protein SE17_41020, partial [Kouleothrix aurantiaca]